MKSGKAYAIDYRRKREGRTDYRTRIKLLASGMPRVVVRRSLNNSYIQITEFSNSGDRVLVSSSTLELIDYGWKAHRGNIPAAYLAGFLCGLKAKSKNILSGVLDIGVYRAVKGASIFAAVAGLKDAGFNINAGNAVPDKARLQGEHIKNYAGIIKNNLNQRFSRYTKAGINPVNITEHMGDVKKRITEKWH